MIEARLGVRVGARWMLATLAALAALWAGGAGADDWPQWRGPARDGVWRETGTLERFAGTELARRWTAKIGSGYSGPTVAGKRVFVTDRIVEPLSQERVHCFDWETGQPLWSHVYDCEYRGVGYEAGPRASVLIHDGRAYSLGSMGHLFCFDAATGRVHWSKTLSTEYDIQMPIWGIASSPLVEGDALIIQVGGKHACLVAFHRQSGQELWRALEDRASYASPIVIEQAGQRVVVCWTGDSVAGLAPQDGKLLWRLPIAPKRMVINAATPVVEDERMFLTSFYDGSMMVRIPRGESAAQLLWARAGSDEQHTDALHSIISTPLMKGGYVYGVDSYGELRCLDAGSGERKWENLTATPKARWSTIHFVQQANRTWLFNERGELLIGQLQPEGFTEISRAKLIAPTSAQLGMRGGVCWSHPAFAHRHVLARNDEELVCASLEPGAN